MLKMGLLWNVGPKYSRLRTEEEEKNGKRTKYEPIQEFEAFEISESEELPDDQSGRYNRFRRIAVVVSWVSVIFSFVSGVVAIVLGEFMASESLFGYGLDAVLDSLSSVAVIWRFNSSGGKSEVGEAKERKACIVISFFFFASSFSLFFKSIKGLVDGDREDVDKDERVMSDVFGTFCGVITLILGIIKVTYGRKLQSRALVTDSIITFVGSFMSFFSVLSLELFEHNDRIWYLDAISGITCALFLLIFGVKLLMQMTCLYGKKKTIISVSNGTNGTS